MKKSIGFTQKVVQECITVYLELTDIALKYKIKEYL
jgi:hypothetical protein